MADELDALTARMEPGDVVLVEDEGRVIGEFTPAPQVSYPAKDNLRRFLEARAKQPPIDDDFVKAVEEAAMAANRPAEAPPWD